MTAEKPWGSDLFMVMHAHPTWWFW